MGDVISMERFIAAHDKKQEEGKAAGEVGSPQGEGSGEG